MALAICPLAAPGNAQAQGAEAYPARVVRLVVPFAAGGSTDLLARNVAQRLTEAWKRSVIIDNRAGGGSIIGSELVARAAPDGHTLLLGTVTSHAVSATLHAKLPYDIQRDFVPITEIAHIPQMLSVHPSLPPRSLKELVALARARPGDLFYGGGIGSAQQMALELLQSRAKIKFTHVPYKGSGPTMIDFLAGQLHVTSDVIMTSLPHKQTGRLRALAVSSLKRSAVADDLPTIAELGYPGYEAIVWFGLFAPAGTPAEIVRKVSEETTRALANAQMREVLLGQGFQIVGSSPAEFTARVGAEIVKWRQVIHGAGIKVQ